MEEGSQAHDIIKGFPASADNYPKVIKVLKERFGNKSLLTQMYIRELFQMGLKNLQEKPELFTIYDKLVGHVQSLESLGIHCTKLMVLKSNHQKENWTSCWNF